MAGIEESLAQVQNDHVDALARGSLGDALPFLVSPDEVGLGFHFEQLTTLLAESAHEFGGEVAPHVAAQMEQQSTNLAELGGNALRSGLWNADGLLLSCAAGAQAEGSQTQR